MKILVINPGSTSTKMAVYEDETPILLRNITHTPEELAGFSDVIEQQDLRRQLVIDELRAADIAHLAAGILSLQISQVLWPTKVKAC